MCAHRKLLRAFRIEFMKRLDAAVRGQMSFFYVHNAIQFVVLRSIDEHSQKTKK